MCCSKRYRVQISSTLLIRDFNECKLYCDTDINCKGFTQTTNESTACQLATNSICPPGCTKRNQCDEDSDPETCDNLDPLVLDAEWGSDSPTGCYIKTTGNCICIRSFGCRTKNTTSFSNI